MYFIKTRQVGLEQESVKYGNATKKGRTSNKINHKTNGLVPKERICGAPKYELLLVFCFVVVVLFRSPFVSVLVISPPGIM